MILDLIAAVACAAVGFGIGRIKNAAKLSAISLTVKTMEAAGITDVAKVIAAVKAKL